MRYRTAAVLSVVLIGGMFGLPDAIKAVFLPSLEQGMPTPVPTYERILLDIAVFGFRFRWVFALPIVVAVVVLFTIAGVTSAVRRRKHDGAPSHPKTTLAPSSGLEIRQPSAR